MYTAKILSGWSKKELINRITMLQDLCYTQATDLLSLSDRMRKLQEQLDRLLTLESKFEKRDTVPIRSKDIK